MYKDLTNTFKIPNLDLSFRKKNKIEQRSGKYSSANEDNPFDTSRYSWR